MNEMREIHGPDGAPIKEAIAVMYFNVGMVEQLASLPDDVTKDELLAIAMRSVEAFVTDATETYVGTENEDEWMKHLLQSMQLSDHVREFINENTIAAMKDNPDMEVKIVTDGGPR